MPETPKLIIPITADTKKAAANLTGLKNKTKQELGGIAGIANKVKANFFQLAAGIAATGLIMKKFIGIAADFEQSIANVASVSGDSRKELEALAREMGARTVFSAKQAADAMYFLASAGLAVADMNQVLEPSLNLAAAAQIGVAEASDLVVNNLKVFNAEMADAAKFTDIMATTAKNANTDIPQLGEALKVAGSTAKLAGISFEDLNVLIAGMANQGIKGAEAGTKLRQSFARLLKPTAEAQKVLSKYNITQTDINNNIKDPIKLFKLLTPAIQNTAEATEILGVRQLAVAGLMRDGIPDLERMKAAMEDAGGAAKNMADQQLDTLQGSLKLLQSAFQEVILSGAGEGGLLDIFKSIVEVLIGAVRAFQQVPGPIKAITIGILILTPAVIAFQAALGPIGLIALGIAAALGVLLPKMVDFRDIGRETNDVLKKLNELQEDYKTVIEKLKDPTNKLAKEEKALLENRKALLELEIEEQILKLADAYDELGTAIDKNRDAQDDINKAYELTKSSTTSVQKELDNYINKTATMLDQFIKVDKRLLNTEKGWETLVKRIAGAGLAHEDEVQALVTLSRRREEFNLKLAAATKIRKLNSEVARGALKLDKDEATLLTTKKALIDALAKKNIDLYNNEKTRVGVEQELAFFGVLISDGVIKRIKELNKLIKVEKDTGAAVKGRTLEEVNSINELSEKRKFLLEQSLATEEEITELSEANVNKRIEGWKRELNERIKLMEQANEFLKLGFEVAGNIIDSHFQDNVDRRNIYSEELARMDAEDAERAKKSLIDEIAVLEASGTAADLALAEEKKRQLQRINIEEAEALRNRKIKRDEAIATRKAAKVERDFSALSIVAQTAIAVGKAIAGSPFSFGQPWAGAAIASGILQELALFSKPLPSVPAFAKGGNFTTSGPMLAMLGDNPSGRESVNIQPLRSFQSEDNSVNTKSSVNIERLEVLSNDPEEMFNKVYDYADNMGMRIVRRGG